MKRKGPIPHLAITPVTWGAAMEVPDAVELASVLPIDADKISEPGANMSTQGPLLDVPPEREKIILDGAAQKSSPKL